MRYCELDEATAFHGTPHDFDKFSVDHISSGEGNQVYGWGLYFASRKEVAEWYRDKLSPKIKATISHQIFLLDSPSFHHQGKIDLIRITRQHLPEIVDTSNKNSVLSICEMFKGWGYALIEDLLNRISKDRNLTCINDEAKLFIKRLRSSNLLYEDEEQNWKKIVDLICHTVKNNVTLDIPKSGRLYHVEIPDNRHWLYWDQPYGEQTPEVKAALQSCMTPPDAVVEYAAKYFPKARDLFAVWDHWLENERKARLNGARLYAILEDDLNSAKEASLTLKAKGITGIMYLDGVSRSSGQGQYNYVVFDGSDVGIVQKDIA